MKTREQLCALSNALRAISSGVCAVDRLDGRVRGVYPLDDDTLGQGGIYLALDVELRRRRND